MFKDSNGLSPEQAAMYLEIVDASLRVTRKDQIFPWLQGCFQYLFPHEIMVCGIEDMGGAGLRFESYSSVRYFTEQHRLEATEPQKGLIWRAMKAWHEVRRPVLVADGLPAGNGGGYCVPFAESGDSLMQSELQNLAAHGMCGDNGNVSTFFCFSRVRGQLGASHAYLLQLLIPHLHSAIVRATSQVDSAWAGSSGETPHRQVTEREVEILHWVNMGKTNWEIAQILEISPLTVKNHVQNILRKLNVQSRGHAAIKAGRIGLIRG